MGSSSGGSGVAGSKGFNVASNLKDSHVVTLCSLLLH